MNCIFKGSVLHDIMPHFQFVRSNMKRKKCLGHGSLNHPRVTGVRCYNQFPEIYPLPGCSNLNLSKHGVVSSFFFVANPEGIEGNFVNTNFSQNIFPCCVFMALLHLRFQDFLVNLEMLLVAPLWGDEDAWSSSSASVREAAGEATTSSQTFRATASSNVP